MLNLLEQDIGPVGVNQEGWNLGKRAIHLGIPRYVLSLTTAHHPLLLAQLRAEQRHSLSC